MAADPNPVLRAQLNAALAVLDPELVGLVGLSGMQISQPSRDAINLQIVNRARRQTFIQAVLNALDAVVEALVILDNDGYPSLPNVFEPPEILAEIQTQQEDVTIAAGIFGITSGPVSISLDLKNPVLVPQPKPVRLT